MGIRLIKASTATLPKNFTRSTPVKNLPRTMVYSPNRLCNIF
ncbi:MAG: hypothetical protein ACI9BF_000853, partial [Candidatus Paceibacteria bacterium]